MSTEIPGFTDLFVNVEEHAVDHELVQNAAFNELYAILNGLQGLGHLLWVAHTASSRPNPDVTFEEEHAAQVGILIERMACQAELLWELEKEAAYQVRKQEKASDESQPTIANICPSPARTARGRK